MVNKEKQNKTLKHS